MTRRSETVEVVLKQLSSVNIPAEVEGKKHAKIRFVYQRKRYTYTVPRTASDRRAVMNCRCGIRRLLRQIGVAI